MEAVNISQEQTCSNCTSLAEELAATKAELESTQAINAELTKEIESLSTKADTGNSDAAFEIEGQIFGFHFHKAVFLGKAITHTDVLQDPSLQKQLVEAGSGMIKAK
jgi:hypothetical protein